MSATIARPQTQEPSHWYWPYTGEPCYETQPGKPTTLRDARKLGLVPSVTTILSCRHKPALQSWLVEQAVLAAVTTPRLPDESLDAFIERVLHTERHQDQESDKAKARGTQIHDAMEKLFKGEPIDEEIKPWVMPAYEEVSKFGVALEAEKCFASNGYGGRCDLLMRTGITFNEMLMVWDWKSAKTLPKEPYLEARLQVAAYCMALEAERGGNVYISTTNCGEFRLFEHQDIVGTYYKGFETLFGHWKWANKWE